MFVQALQPFRTHTGTPYPCLQSSIDFHTLPSFPHKNNSKFVSTLSATNEILWQNHPLRALPPAEKEAIARLQTVLPSNDQNIGPDLAIKAFHDLDLVFFAGKLHNNVTVHWADSHTDEHFLRIASSHPLPILGFTDRNPDRLLSERGQCRIVLNARTLLRGGDGAPMECCLETLLHEMVHAFHFCRVSVWGWGLLGWKKRGVFRYDDCHDEHFGSQISAVSERASGLLGLRAVHFMEPYRCHHFLGELVGDGCGGEKGWEGGLVRRSAGKHRRLI